MLTGPSSLPDPAFHAYRKDLADVALASEVLASHYAEPVSRTAAAATELKSAPSESSAPVRELAAGEEFKLLEETLGWAWGYAASDGRVGYVRSAALSAAN